MVLEVDARCLGHAKKIDRLTEISMFWLRKR